ncbi:MAG TPA: hypothetical protein VE553_08700 [Candidatus Binatia bacterium]|jgi:hypothetical protein|nr:hypothetical protein [Candidatus Binatia bacterium]
MMTQEERRKMLDMVASGQMSAAEAAELFATSGKSESPEAAGEKEGILAQKPDVVEKASSGAAGPKWLHVRVNDLKSGRRKVLVNIPLGLVRFGMQMGRGWVPEMADLDWDALNEAVTGGEDGILIDVQDEEDGEHVQIYVD